MRPEASCFLKRLASDLALHWNKHYIEIVHWIRATSDICSCETYWCVSVKEEQDDATYKF